MDGWIVCAEGEMQVARGMRTADEDCNVRLASRCKRQEGIENVKRVTESGSKLE